ncbi:MAG: hypothetical protein Q9173_007223 [Seirophora scorigena]
MAPTVGRRTRRRSTASNSNAQSLFSTTKKDKRIIKHSALLSRIEKSRPAIRKRRRPSKKLLTNLDSLAEALPDLTPAAKPEAAGTAAPKIKHKSLRSRPGAMKKKEKIISLEKDRFNKNMAQMATVHPPGRAAQNGHQPDDADCTVHTGPRWAALRTLIQKTMEQRWGPA